MNKTRTIEIAGIHCASCIVKTSTALKGVPGVLDADVSLDPNQAILTLAHEVEDHDLDKALRDAGDYSIAGMTTAETGTENQQETESLYPLLLIVTYLAGTVLFIAWTSQDWAPGSLMRHFMAGFFLVFSFFKLLDLAGFVDAYQSYDLLAKAIPGWASVYPFIELILGVAYLIAFSPFVTNLVTLILMLAGAVGVSKALLDRRAIRCACLGTALNLPMTKVTLIEDLSMALMAAVMLVIH